MPISALTGLYIDQTYPRLVQTQGGEFADGLGQAITLITSTGSLLTTASIVSNSNTIRFTKGNGSFFDITVNTGSAGGASFPYTGSAIISGSLVVTGSTTSTLGFTGSLFGTSSWASNATSASYYKETDPIFTATSASLATTGSNTFIGNQTITGSIILPTLVGVTDVNVNFTIPSNPSGIYKVTAQADPGTLDMGSIIFPSVVEGTSFTIIVTGNVNGVIVSSPYPINARSQDVTLLGNQKIYNFYGINGYWYAGSLSLP